MNEIQIFNNPQFGQIRAIEVNGEPYFVGIDVAKALGYENTNAAITQHVDLDDCVKHGVIDKLGRNQDTTIINESGVYSLVFGSKLLTAKVFKKWVTSEVLPTIRKHGAYATPATIDAIIADPDFGIKLLSSLKEEQEKRREIEAKMYQQQEIIEIKNDEIKQLLPDAEYTRETLKSVNTYCITQIAKELGMSGTALNKKLYKMGIQYKVNNQWVLYLEYEDKGYTETSTYTETVNDVTISRPQTVWTELGRKFIHELLKKEIAA